MHGFKTPYYLKSHSFEHNNTLLTYSDVGGLLGHLLKGYENTFGRKNLFFEKPNTYGLGNPFVCFFGTQNLCNPYIG